MSACLLSLSVVSLLLPVSEPSDTFRDFSEIGDGADISQTAFHASFRNSDIADQVVLKVSRGTSVVSLTTTLATP